MVPDSSHDFFVATASAAGALVGLLFVALSVWREREQERHATESESLRASAALTVFTNALSVSLFALIPGEALGEAATIIAGFGLAFVVASALRLGRLHRAGLRLRVRDVVFIAGSTALFVFELLDGIALWIHPQRAGRVSDIATLVVFSLLFGIARSWELIGGPQVGVVSEMSAILRHTPAVEEEDAEAEEA